MPARRCFVALEPPDELLGAAHEVREALRKQFPDLRYVSRENLHLTLKFLGEISAEHRFMGHVTIARVKGISDRLRRTVEGLEVPRATAKATGFTLQESHLSHEGPRYETIARFTLAAD